MYEKELGQCCADFYNHPVVKHLLDGVFHPGGVALTKLMAKEMGIDSTSRVLDIACGDGMSAAFLAKTLKCHVTGIDVGSDMIRQAIERSQNMGVGDLTNFQTSLATELPFRTGYFSAVYSECALCTFPDKETAVSEILRVLAEDGVVGISDVVISDYDLLDTDLQGLFGQVSCIAGALSAEDYISLFKNEGCRLLTTSNHSEQLEVMARQAVGKAKLSVSLSSIDSDIKEKYRTALDLLESIICQIKDGVIGYHIFIFQK
ncbi:MAG: methyltransferase domain-containing protein [Candidatus Lokiarchaeota archaeon]|nr:methyltransferase domain-containing protein [Candidatus Lokiarchaeota archaeon]